MARWEEVLDIALEMHEWLTGPFGMLFGEGYFGSTFQDPKNFRADGSMVEGNPSWRSEEEARQQGRAWAHALGVQVFNAEPVWVDPDMMTVIESAIDNFTPEPLIETDLITPNGLLVLPRSLWLTDPSNNRLSWKAACWFPSGRGGIHLTLFHDTHDRDDVDLSDEELQRLGKRFTTRFLPTHVVNWSFGDFHPGFDDDLAAGQDRAQSAHAQLQATWRLMTQYLAVNTRQRVPRAYAKRAARAKMPTEQVTIVRLRRPTAPKDPDSEPKVVNWQSRWLVGGHWRNQWYATLGPAKNPDGTFNKLSHRQVWISPFVKGPADMPLKANKGRVFEFMR